MRLREATGLLLCLGLAACILPVRSAPGVEGQVVDRETGEPVEGAIVVVRWDGRTGDALPDREKLGHAETVTGADGFFSLPGYRRGGLSVWPLFRTETRVVAVIHPRYRCPQPRQARASESIRIALAPALVAADRRETCRPVRARRGEAEGYMAAWRGLFPAPETPEQREDRQQLERLLEARAALGFGSNCWGPVTDLALAPDGARVAFVSRGPGGSQAHVVELGPGSARESLSRSVKRTPPRQLAWTGPGELVLWHPTTPAERTVSFSIFARGRSEVLWSDERSLPASADPGIGVVPQGTSALRPIEPADLRDDADRRWQGRGFALERTVDPMSGLPRDRVRVTHPDGSRHTVDLPGEACGGLRFGRPHYRIDVSARTGLDLRFVDGGCHAVRIDLEEGSWTRLDDSEAAASCRSRRRIPPAQLAAALRGWTRDLRNLLRGAGADADASYALEIDDGGTTRVLTHDFSGVPITVDGPAFPLQTPLRRIDVTQVSPSTRATTVPEGSSPPLELLAPL